MELHQALVLVRQPRNIEHAQAGIKQDAARSNPAVFRQDAHNRVGGDGFTAAGFAHNAHGFSDGNIVADGVHRADNAFVRTELHNKVSYLDEVFRILHTKRVSH